MVIKRRKQTNNKTKVNESNGKQSPVKSAKGGKQSAIESPKGGKGGAQLDGEMDSGFMKFFAIDLKSDSDVRQLTDKKRKQYVSRLMRWHSLLDTEIEWQCFRATNLAQIIDNRFALQKRQIEKLKSEGIEDEKELSKMEKRIEKMERELKSDRQLLDDLRPVKKINGKIKPEVVDLELEHKEKVIKVEDMSDEDEAKTDGEMLSDSEDSGDSNEWIKQEIKEEYTEEEEVMDSKDGVKREIKSEIKSEFDVKPKIKTEIKSEIKSEIKGEIKEEETDDEEVEFSPNRVKIEYVSSDEEFSE